MPTLDWVLCVAYALVAGVAVGWVALLILSE